MKVRGQRNIKTYAEAYVRAAAKKIRVQPIRLDPKPKRITNRGR